MKKLLVKFQRQIVKILNKSKKPLYISSKDNCSEISRLLGYWFIKDCNYKAYILKGNVFNSTNIFHDILVIEYKRMFYILDPTIWQFFKYKKSIFIDLQGNLDKCILFANSFYKGQFIVSEYLNINNFSKTKLLKVINSNLKSIF